ncbi:MAG: MlaA family lipoprotein [Gammaproteobacteria bacterium]
MNKPILLSVLLLSFAVMSGCATTKNPDGTVNVDPYEKTNRSIYNFNDTLDRNIMRPVAEGYRKITPEPVRDSVTNFFDNLKYLNVMLNSFLQGKFNNGVSDTVRFVVNSTVGIGGLFDMATPVGLEEHQEDFGQTLAVWGVGQGAYLNLPFAGPNTSGNVPDYGSSYVTNPLSYVGGLFLFPVALLNAVNSRANLLDASEFVDEAALDPYTFTREAYLQHRAFLIHDGNLPESSEDDLFDVDMDDESLLIID